MVLGHLLAPAPPGQDAPPHIVSAAIMSAPEAYSAYYAVNWAPTAQAFEALTIVFHTFLPLFWAAKLTIIVFCGLLCGACAVIARRLGGEPTLGLALGAAYGIGWIAAMGFYNFIAGLALGMVAAALIFCSECRPRHRLGAAVLFVGAAWAHIIAAALVAGFVLAARVLAGGISRLGKTLVHDVTTLAPASGFIAYFTALAVSSAQDSGRIESVESVSARWLAHSFDTTFGGFSPTGWLLAAGVLVAICFAERNARNTRIVALIAASTCVLIALPLHAIGWHFAKPRPAFFVFVALPMLLRFRPGGRVVLLLTIGAAVSASISALGNIREGRRIADGLAMYPSGDAGLVLEANFRPEPTVAAGPGIRSAIGLPHYATLGGGALPGAFATNPRGHSLSFVGGMALFPNTPFLSMVVPRSCREDAECYRSDAWRGDVLSVVGGHWDSIALVDPPRGVLERLEARGGEVDGWLVQPRSADARVHLPDGIRGPVAWRIGYTETIGVFEDGAAVIESDGVVIRATDIPAGPTRIMVFIDHDGDGEPGPGELVLMDREETLAVDAPTEIAIELRR